MRELAEASRTETAPAGAARAAPVRALSADTAAVVRARLSGAVPEMIDVIGRTVPEYASWPRPEDQRRLADAVTAAVAQFIAHITQPRRSTQAITAEFRAIGRAAAREGRTLDAPQNALVLPPDVLADWTRPDPCLLVPDPDGPGRHAAIDRALRGRPAAIGPSVPLARAPLSLRWARHALALARVGVIPAGHGPVRCDQHLSTLLILADEDLAGALRSRRLAPLARLRPGQRDRIAETLLAWLQLGENAAAVAHQLHVHPQTVRYRLRQIQELFGDQLHDPDRRFELQLALRLRQLTGDHPAGRLL